MQFNNDEYVILDEGPLGFRKKLILTNQRLIIQLASSITAAVDCYFPNMGGRVFDLVIFKQAGTTISLENAVTTTRVTLYDLRGNACVSTGFLPLSVVAEEVVLSLDPFTVGQFNLTIS